jgi:thiol:disulfide interchange protein DsbD
MGFVRQAGNEKRKIVAHGVLFTLGVLVSFWILAGALLALRAGGEELGWGFQLQSPGFVFGMAAFLLLFALNLSGVFEIGFGIAAAGSRAEKGEGPFGSFLAGVLATVVATPCSAPFLATALAGALTLPPLQSVATFTFIALGLAAPYLLLSLFPSLLRKLPKPGAWMETFKQFMAFPLYATVGWLVYVLAGQADGENLLEALLALTGLALAAWIFGRFAAPHRKPAGRRVAAVAAALLLGVSIGYGVPRESEYQWIPWSRETVQSLREDDRIVYVDFTARWCATCQVNKEIVFGSGRVREFVRAENVALVKADWTNEDPAITKRLLELGKAAVPVNLVYLPDRPEPIVLPETLTPGIVLEALQGGDVPAGDGDAG